MSSIVDNDISRVRERIEGIQKRFSEIAKEEASLKYERDKLAAELREISDRSKNSATQADALLNDHE